MLTSEASERVPDLGVDGPPAAEVSTSGGDAAAPGFREVAMPSNQPPLMTAHNGGGAHAVRAWEARATYEIGVLMRRYLADHPPPAESSAHDQLDDWGDRLQAAGAARLRELGVRRLQVAS